jgi:hypothetical protein
VRIFNAMRPLDDTIVFIVVAAVSDANGSSPKSSAVSPSSFFSVVVVVALAPLAANPRAPSNARLNSSTSFIGTAIARASSTLNLAKSIGVVNQFASSVAAILAPTSSSLRPSAFAHAATNARSSVPPPPSPPIVAATAIARAALLGRLAAFIAVVFARFAASFMIFSPPARPSRVPGEQESSNASRRESFARSLRSRRVASRLPPSTSALDASTISRAFTRSPVVPSRPVASRRVVRCRARGRRVGASRARPSRARAKTPAGGVVFRATIEPMNECGSIVSPK